MIVAAACLSHMLTSVILLMCDVVHQFLVLIRKGVTSTFYLKTVDQYIALRNLLLFIEL